MTIQERATEAYNAKRADQLQRDHATLAGLFYSVFLVEPQQNDGKKIIHDGLTFYADWTALGRHALYVKLRLRCGHDTEQLLFRIEDLAEALAGKCTKKHFPKSSFQKLKDKIL